MTLHSAGERTILVVGTLLLMVSLLFLSSCSPSLQDTQSAIVEQAGAKPISGEDFQKLAKIAGQTVYVPIYSQIYHRENHVFDLTATLSIRNTDQRSPIYISRVTYFDTAGKPVRDYLTSPVQLPALATLEYIVGEKDNSGGTGANFIVEWAADCQVSEPIVEAVMIGTSSQQGVSFLSVGKPIE